MCDELATTRSGKTVHNIYIRTKQILNHAVRDKLIPVNPALAAIPPRYEPADTIILQPGQRTAAIHAAHDPKPRKRDTLHDDQSDHDMWALMFDLAFATGMRQAERFGITPHPNHPPQTAKPPVLYACMHLYASRDAYRKSPEKARKPLYIKEKTKFLSLVCIVCINIRGFLPFSRILYKGMMHTMHTRPRTIPGTLEPSRNGRKRCMHPRMHTDAYTRTGMHTRPGPHARGRIPGGMEYEIHATRDGAYGPVDYTTPLPGGLTFADMLAATRAAADTTGRPATLVDDEGEPVLTIESDIMVL